jgi:hypothetical protein
VLQVQGVGSFAQRHHVDQPGTQVKRKGNPGDDLHRTAGPSPPRAAGGGQRASSAPASGGARPARGHEVRKKIHAVPPRILFPAQHAGPSIVRVVGGEQRASGAASLPSGERSPSHGVY